ncbi:MAG: hypothetical protein ACUVXI_16375 [bacterium]
MGDRSPKGGNKPRGRVSRELAEAIRGRNILIRALKRETQRTMGVLAEALEEWTSELNEIKEIKAGFKRDSSTKFHVAVDDQRLIVEASPTAYALDRDFWGKLERTDAERAGKLSWEGDFLGAPEECCTRIVFYKPTPPEGGGDSDYQVGEVFVFANGQIRLAGFGGDPTEKEPPVSKDRAFEIINAAVYHAFVRGASHW